ncbi:sigma-54-dependent transcriptional regulator [Sporolactobacillus putidus]|uniref:Transcriptional regulatory protein LevR n=1 Tax=Sporolactobacillus putidus TaxID=492735 RepID=A0A917RXM8_9BACL|nr:sigma-54-dependent transcriptional regulator [Sporolactobacillus putidus]GGL42979.1 transcriptional regulatory protein LevR [Sporolactobacillus putidus]
MKRIDRIYQQLEEKCDALKKDQLLEREGFSADDLADDLDMLRNNVSLELNNLVRLGKVIKIKKRPVLYIPRDTVKKNYGYIIDQTILDISSLKELYLAREKADIGEDEDPFSLLIGSDGSLKKLTGQAKAAVVYPPRGLHTLILGPTGSGKTLFAHMMHSYAVYMKRMDKNSPFIVFNCADYYNNPQLLISQIFGHVKGAFTGAESDKQGLVEKADGGILFLDEVHRLPPEGQEMIFYFMDTGRYNRLGETEKRRQAKVLIIAATTEDPSSSFLQTFLRRIPVTITMPSFHERQAKEKVDLTKYLLSKEAKRIHKDIKVNEDVIKALIGSVTFGNVGQLKSNIQFVCAQGFLDSMDSPYVNLYVKMLPQEMKEGLSLISRNARENEEISNEVGKVTVITGEGSKELVDDDVYELPFDMYKIIEDKANLLRQENVDPAEINRFVATDIKLHIKSFYQQVTKRPNMKLSKLVDERVINLAEELRSLAESMLHKTFNDKFLYFISFHIDGFLKRKSRLNAGASSSHGRLIDENEIEYQVALKMREIIEEKLKVRLPKIEVMYLAILLVSANELNQKGKVGIVVAAHGNSTATSIVNVTKELLGDYNIRAVDMPLDISFKVVLGEIAAAVRQMDRGEGVLMLVDMGSLYYFEEKIREKSDIEVKAVDRVSTPMVLDAVRKANFLDMDLKSIAASLKSPQNSVEEEIIQASKNQGKPKAILTICSSGQGAAKKIDELIKTFLGDITDEPIKIIPLSVDGLNQNVQELEKKYTIIASVGVRKPRINAPFISLEHFIEGEGQLTIKQAIRNERIHIKNGQSDMIVRGLCEDSLKMMLTYLNPYRAISTLMHFCDNLQKELDVHFKNTTTFRIVVHSAFALERAVRGEVLQYKDGVTDEKKGMLAKVKNASQVIEKEMNIQLAEDEIYCLVDLLQDEFADRPQKVISH